MAAFELRQDGVFEVEADEGHDPTAIVSAADAVAMFRAMTPPTPLKAEVKGADPPLTQKSKISEITPKTVIQAAKARVAEIKTELRHHKRLQTELFQLESLLVAAKAKPKTAKTH